MFIPEKYKESIGKNGFPVGTSVEDVIKIALQMGDQLKKNQARVVAGHQRPLSVHEDTVIKINSRESLFFPLEVTTFGTITHYLNGLGKKSGLGKIGILSEEADAVHQKDGTKATVAVGDANWFVDPISDIREYLRDGKKWSLRIGFGVEATPTGGVIYEPHQNELTYTDDDGKAYRRNTTGNALKITALKHISLDRDVKGSAARGTLVAEFAKTIITEPYKVHNPAVWGNVALKAIYDRVAGADPQITPVTPEMPFHIFMPR
jgi:hypothetical protein